MISSKHFRQVIRVGKILAQSYSLRKAGILKITITIYLLNTKGSLAHGVKVREPT